MNAPSPTTASARRQSVGWPVSFVSLPPGDYALEFRRRMQDGTLGAAVTLRFTLERSFLETTAARVGLPALAMLLTLPHRAQLDSHRP